MTVEVSKRNAKSRTATCPLLNCLQSSKRLRLAPAARCPNGCDRRRCLSFQSKWRTALRRFSRNPVHVRRPPLPKRRRKDKNSFGLVLPSALMIQVCKKLLLYMIHVPSGDQLGSSAHWPGADKAP